MLAMVKEDFRTRAARAGIPHRPEVIGGRNANDAVIRKTGNLFPQRIRLIIGMIDSDQQLVRREAIFLGDQVPGKFNCVFLEIIAKRKVAEHFKKRMMARGPTDIFKVVMFAPGPYAFLRRGRARIVALFLTGENVLKLNHPGVGKHQGRVIARHQRAG